MDFLGKVASILGPAAELKNFIYEPVKRELDYLLCYDDNVKNVRDEAGKLEDKRAGLQLRIEEAENNARVVLPEVESWLREVTHIQAKMDEIETEIATVQNMYGCFSRSLHRRSVSKRVEVIAEAMKELQKLCVFEIISVPPPPAASAPIQLGSTFEFESRKHIEEGVMMSLRDGEVYKVGICGMGGVGKTTMAKRIMHRARQERLFVEIVMVVVSQNADKARIQEDIATSLGLKLEERSQPSRAHLLRTRLSNGAKRSLIIVDDIWEHLNLDDLGIPCGNHCKVLLTSRDRDVFKKMNVEKVHGVNLLTDAEAWHFFQLNAGNCAGHPNVVSVAQQVVKECKRLPIALKTVGAALKDTKHASVWEDSLQQLRSSNPSDMPDVLNDVYKPLRLSYDFLHNKQIQSLFLMCCLYQEDGDIPIEDLAIYALGLGIFEELERLEHERNRVYSLVETLKSRSLLLEGDSENHVKMHDVVRDVAIFIASGEKLIPARSKSNDCTWNSSHIRKTIGFHGESTSFPKLRLLWIDYKSRDIELEIHDHFFEGMKELHVLSISSSPMKWLPKTTRFLENLETLVLKDCHYLESISVVGELVNLKILICRWCHSIVNLPTEIRRLSGLKILELSGCVNLEIIPPGIISKLKKLEELILRNCFNRWEAKNVGKESKNALLSELEHLSNLSCLTIEIMDPSLAAEHIHLPPKLKEYEIIIGVPQFDFYNHEHLIEEYEICKRKMKLVLPENIISAEWIRKLVGSVEYLYIEGDGSKYLDFGAAQDLRVLVFNDCSTVKTLVSSTTTDMVFPRLEILHLEELSELKVICHIDGPPMSSNSSNNLQGIKSILFPVLEEMYVYECRRLESFVCITSPDDGDISVPCKPQKFEFDSLRKLEVVGGYSGSMCRNWCPMITTIFSRLSELDVYSILNTKSLFPYSVAQNLHNLKSLSIIVCYDMVGVIEDDACGGQTPPTPLLPNLETIYLSCLKKLKSFCECKHALEFPSLTSLSICDCDLMEEFTSGHVSTPFLPHIQIGYQTVDFLNISNGVNDSLKQRWLERQQELNSRLKHQIVEMVMEDHNSQEEEEEVMMSSNNEGDRIEEVQKRVEEVDAWLSIGPPNESLLHNLRLIEAEEEHIRLLEGSSLQQKMKAPVEIMEKNVKERHSESMVRKRHTALENEFQPEKRRRIGAEVKYSERSSLLERMKALTETMVQNEEEVINHLDSMIEKWRNDMQG